MTSIRRFLPRLRQRVALELLALLFTFGMIEARTEKDARAWRAVWTAFRPDVVRVVDRRMS
jgi:hypothetical protein